MLTLLYPRFPPNLTSEGWPNKTSAVKARRLSVTRAFNRAIQYYR
jgi:hypothetical protein